MSLHATMQEHSEEMEGQEFLSNYFHRYKLVNLWIKDEHQYHQLEMQLECGSFPFDEMCLRDYCNFILKSFSLFMNFKFERIHHSFQLLASL